MTTPGLVQSIPAQKASRLILSAVGGYHINDSICCQGCPQYLLISFVVAAASEDEVDEVEVVDGSEVGAAGLVLPAVRVKVHVAQRAEPRGRHGHPSLSRRERVAFTRCKHATF